MNAYRAAEYLQSCFSFNDEYEVVEYNRTRLQPILGDDYKVEGFSDYADIDSNLTEFYRQVRTLTEKRFGNLPF